MLSIERKSDRFFGDIENLDIDEIRLPTFRFRVVNDIEIKKMADSIRQHGLLQPIVVRPKEEGFFEVVAGCYSIFCMSITTLEKDSMSHYTFK